jgi:hypothetical protein
MNTTAKTYRGFTILRADSGSHRWSAELNGSRVEFETKCRVGPETVTTLRSLFASRRDLLAAIDAHIAIEAAAESGLQRFESHYGREAIEVSAECPTRAIRWLLGNIHVGTSDAEIEAEVRRRANPATDARWTEEFTAEAVRFALWEAEENRALYRMCA